MLFIFTSVGVIIVLLTMSIPSFEPTFRINAIEPIVFA